MEFRHSTLKEREDFYTNQFDEKKVFSWFNDYPFKKPQLLAVDMGTETKIIKDKSKLKKMLSIKAENIKKKKFSIFFLKMFIMTGMCIKTLIYALRNYVLKTVLIVITL